jgi:hypothetical protein
MKKVLLFVLSVMLVVVIVACSSPEPQKGSEAITPIETPETQQPAQALSGADAEAYSFFEGLKMDERFSVIGYKEQTISDKNLVAHDGQDAAVVWVTLKGENAAYITFEDGTDEDITYIANSIDKVKKMSSNEEIEQFSTSDMSDYAADKWNRLYPDKKGEMTADFAQQAWNEYSSYITLLFDAAANIDAEKINATLDKNYFTPRGL